jgi:hypothetical protein
MQAEYLIAVDEFCANHNIEMQKTGLIEITTIKETGFIDAGQLQLLEKFVRFYYELDINFEGIETITHLLQRINAMQDEITALKNRLRLYETNE